MLLQDMHLIDARLKTLTNREHSMDNLQEQASQTKHPVAFLATCVILAECGASSAHNMLCIQLLTAASDRTKLLTTKESRHGVTTSALPQQTAAAVLSVLLL